MTTDVEQHPLVTEPPKVKRRRNRIAIVITLVLICFAIGVAVFLHEWPFTRESIVQALQQQSGSTVQIGRFHQVYFPQPGCAAEQVVFRRGTGSSPPLIAIQKLTITGTYPGLLLRHISTIRADGLRISVPPGQTDNGSLAPINIGSLHSGLTIGQIVADGAAVEFPAADRRESSLIFRIPKLTLHDLVDNQPLAYQATLLLPRPPAEISLTGKFGPWVAGHGGQSHMSGSYLLTKLDLGAFSGIDGTVSSRGNFDGVLQHVKVQGSVDTPNFGVRRSHHRVQLAAEYAATVNGLNGDVELNSSNVYFGRTTIQSAGSIAGERNAAGKTAVIEMSSSRARIQDLLWLFVSEDKPPMTGSIVFRAKATLTPEDRPFLDKVKLLGDFGITAAQYPNPKTQRNVDVLSARARGEADKVEDQDDKLGNDSYDPGRVMSNVRGHVLLSGGIAKLSDVTFNVPGAAVRVSGTYNLKTERIDLRGQMWLDTKLSKATTGIKSFLLKIIQPLTAAKQQKGSVVSVAIGGTYRNPTYTVLPTAKK